MRTLVVLVLPDIVPLAEQKLLEFLDVDEVTEFFVVSHNILGGSLLQGHVAKNFANEFIFALLLGLAGLVFFAYSLDLDFVVV